MEYITFFFFSTITALLLTPSAIEKAEEWGLVDFPSERKRHLVPTPLTGGLILYPISVIALLAAYGLNRQNLIILGAMTIIVLLGLWDDLRGCHRLVKLFWQLTAASLVIYSGVVIDFKRMVLVRELGLQTNGVESALVTLLWIVGVTNAVNLVDGLDGLAAGLSLNAFIGVGALAMVGGQPGLALLCAIMAGGIVGYLKYNINPAKTFLGDSGSLLLGFMISVVSIMHATKATTFVVLVIPILFIAIPMTDTAFAFIRRTANGKNPLVADREHIHHRLLDLQFSQKQTVGYFYSFSVILACLALLLAQIQASHILAFAMLVIVMMVAAVKACQICNFHDVISRINTKLASLAKRVVIEKGDKRRYTIRATAFLFLLFAINVIFAYISPTEAMKLILAGSGTLFVLGLVELVLTKEGNEDSERGIINFALFLSILVFQLNLYLYWHDSVFGRSNIFAMTAILVCVVLFFVWQTKSFVIFLDEPMEIITVFMGLVLCALVKHAVGASSILPLSIVMVNTICLYIMMKMALLEVHFKSRVFATGTVSTSFFVAMVPWLI